MAGEAWPSRVEEFIFGSFSDLREVNQKSAWPATLSNLHASSYRLLSLKMPCFFSIYCRI
jgi:hypothetical protein